MQREVITPMHGLEFDTQRKGLIVQSPTTTTDVPYFSIFPSSHTTQKEGRRIRAKGELTKSKKRIKDGGVMN
jgi:hypothetical protein